MPNTDDPGKPDIEGVCRTHVKQLFLKSGNLGMKREHIILKLIDQPSLPLFDR